MNSILTLGQETLYRWSFGHTGNSTQALDTENLYIFIVWVNIIGFLLVFVPLVYFTIKYHRGKQARNYQVSVGHNTPLELAWSIIPLLIMVPIFFWGFKGYIDKLAAPTDSEEINITGQKWDWSAAYRNGAESGTEMVTVSLTGKEVPIFYVPAGRPVKLILHSIDVIHSFFIPDFRTKIDVFPNRYTSMWFQAKDPTPLLNPPPADAKADPYGKNPDGTPVGHKVFCAEYCGENHSEMQALIRVLSPKDYYAKIDALARGYKPGSTLLDVGAIVYKRKNCVSCHSVDGSKNTGPTWKNMFGNPVEFSDGTSIPAADENYVRESILYSQKKIVKGFPTSMPVMAGQIKDREVDALIFYIKSLSDKVPRTAIDSENQLYDTTAAPGAPGAPGAPAPAAPAPKPQ